MPRKPRNGQELKGNDGYEGYCADLTKKIASFVNFDYVIQPVKDGSYGAEDENGTWNGMVGELVRNVSHGGSLSLLMVAACSTSTATTADTPNFLSSLLHPLLFSSLLLAVCFVDNEVVMEYVSFLLSAFSSPIIIICF